MQEVDIVLHNKPSAAPSVEVVCCGVRVTVERTRARACVRTYCDRHCCQPNDTSAARNAAALGEIVLFFLHVKKFRLTPRDLCQNENKKYNTLD